MTIRDHSDWSTLRGVSAMPSPVRKLVLIAHVTTSVGWLGAVVGFLALNAAALMSEDAQLARGAYRSMEWMILYSILPLSLGSLIVGVVQSLGTSWGLFRHYWVVFKLIINVLANLILLVYTQTMSAIADAAADATLSAADLRGLGASPMVHATGALLLLLLATALSIFKPRGLTPYGLRKAREQRSMPR